MMKISYINQIFSNKIVTCLRMKPYFFQAPCISIHGYMFNHFTASVTVCKSGIDSLEPEAKTRKNVS